MDGLLVSGAFACAQDAGGGAAVAALVAVLVVVGLLVVVLVVVLVRVMARLNAAPPAPAPAAVAPSNTQTAGEADALRRAAEADAAEIRHQAELAADAVTRDARRIAEQEVHSLTAAA